MHHELPARLDPERYRKEAKRLVKAVRAGDGDALERAREVLGARVASRFLLSDAQHVLGVEHGYRTWAEFVHALESAQPERPVGRIGTGPVEDYEQRAAELAAAAAQGEETAVRRVRANVPRLAAFDGGALSEADARLVVAREYGFPSWRDLVHFAGAAHAEAVAGPSALHLEGREVVRSGDAERLRAMLDAEPRLADRLLEDLTQPDVFGEVSDAFVELIVERATNLDECLNVAACFDKAWLVQRLVDAGGDDTAREIWGFTPLETALYHGARRAADLLASRQIVPYALWTVAALGRVDLLPGFLDGEGRLRPEAGAARPNLADVGWPPGPPPGDDDATILGEALMHAAHNGRTDAVAWLLDHGAEIDSGPYLGFTALHAAAQFGRRETAELLLARGARIDARDEIHGGVAAGWAEHAGHPELVPLLRGEVPVETLRETGLEYLPGEPVRVRVRRRGDRYELDDLGRAVELAAPAPGWHPDAERLVGEAFSLNVSRAGVVFVPARGDRLEQGIGRVADTSLALYQELLDRE